MEIPELSREPLTDWAAKVINLSRENGINDRQIAEWVRTFAKSRGYSNDLIQHVLQRNGLPLKSHYPKLVICPRCRKTGRVNGYHPNKRNKSQVAYVIVHETIGDTWGKEGMDQVPKRRRCYVYSGSKTGGYDYLSKQIAFYETRQRQEEEIVIKPNP